MGIPTHSKAARHASRLMPIAKANTSLTALATAMLAALMPQVAHAQDEPAAAPGEEIVVTGSRISRSTFNSPTPVTVIGSETIQALGQVNIGETIQTLPQ